jgi:hypothetical protein
VDVLSAPREAAFRIRPETLLGAEGAKMNIYRWPDPRTPLGFKLYFLIGLTIGFFGYMLSSLGR